MDPDYFCNPHRSEKLDPDPHEGQNSEALEAQKHSRGVLWTLTMEALEAENGALEGLKIICRRFHHFDEEQDADQQTWFRRLYVSVNTVDRTVYW